MPWKAGAAPCFSTVLPVCCPANAKGLAHSPVGCYHLQLAWGGSSAGRASRSQCEGREFDPPPLHQIQVWLSPVKAGKSLSHKASGLFYVQVRPATSGGILRPEGAG